MIQNSSLNSSGEGIQERTRGILIQQVIQHKNKGKSEKLYLDFVGALNVIWNFQQIQEILLEVGIQLFHQPSVHTFQVATPRDLMGEPSFLSRLIPLSTICLP